MSRKASRPLWHWALVCWILVGPIVCAAQDELRMRVETLTVPPATGPLAMVMVHNTGSASWEGRIVLRPPPSWQLSPDTRTVRLESGETQRLAFNIARGRNLETNRYPFEITAIGPDGQATRRQQTFVASAPYFRVQVDGRPDEWDDAIPISFRTGQRETTISTYWSRRHFSLLVAVDQQELVPWDASGRSSSDAVPFDAVQFALAAVPPPDQPPDLAGAGRFEFLLVATADGGAKCFRLVTPEMRPDEAARPRPLDSLVCDQVEVAVWRNDGITYYECAVPFRLLDNVLLPIAGREFFFSVLVHDPGGTGLRDLAHHAKLWPDRGDPHVWNRWVGGCWQDVSPLGNKIRWGLCTSKY